jgi:hypothetical protein
MTLPKRRLPGTAYFLSPACERHEFRLKPTPETKAAFAFTMVEAANRHGVDIIAVMQMSSHYHAVVYDRLGALSDFLRDFHGMMGRFGSWRDKVENTKFWSAEETGAVEIGDMDALVDCTAYALANPTKDFIVERPEQWVGVMTPVESLGRLGGKVFLRPKAFFDPEGMTSEGVMLSSDYPHELEEAMPLELFRERVRARVEAYVAEAKAEVATGRRRAAAATQGRLKAMLEELLDFRRAHRVALEAFRRGLRGVLFPAGTWFAWRFYGASREDAVNRPLDPSRAGGALGISAPSAIGPAEAPS